MYTHKIVDGVEVPLTPTEILEREAADAAYQALESERMAESVRAERDRLLAESDWTQLTDAPLAQAEVDAWRVYRQALRDVPGQAGFPEAVEWPVEPEE